jgi:DNA-damage-inducible protein D
MTIELLLGKHMVANRKGEEQVKGFKSLAAHDAATAKEGDIAVQSFDGHNIRRIIHKGRPFYSVLDVAGALTGSDNPSAYWGKLKERMASEEGAAEVLTNCQKLRLPGKDGKLYPGDCADIETLLRIIQSIPSKKAEPFKRWLAQVGFERIEETASPSKGIKRAVGRARQAYKNDGRPDDWIDMRLQNVSAHNELHEEWDERGVPEKSKPVIENKMHEEALGISRKDHRKLKKLHDEKIDLPDHMTPLELAIDTLSKTAAKEIVKERDTETVEQTHSASVEGARVAGGARLDLEKRLGRKVVSPVNYLQKPEKKVDLPAPKVKRK